LHVSDFLTPIGCLGSRSTCEILKYGGDVWWDRAKLLEQIKIKAIPDFERNIQGSQALVMFDNAKNHAKYAADALSVSKMNLEDGGRMLYQCVQPLWLMIRGQVVVGIRKWSIIRGYQKGFVQFLPNEASSQYVNLDSSLNVLPRLHLAS